MSSLGESHCNITIHYLLITTSMYLLYGNIASTRLGIHSNYTLGNTLCVLAISSIRRQYVT